MNVAHISNQSVAPPTNQTKTHALLRLSAERKDVLMALRQTGCVSGNYIIVRLFVCLLHYIFSINSPLLFTIQTVQHSVLVLCVYEQRCGVLAKRQGS